MAPAGLSIKEKKLYVCEFIFSLFCVCIYLLCGKIFGEAKSSIGFELTRDRVFDVARITAFVFYQKKKYLGFGVVYNGQRQVVGTDKRPRWNMNLKLLLYATLLIKYSALTMDHLQ